LTKITGPFRVNSQEAVKALESCAVRVNPRGLRVPAVAGRVRFVLGAGWEILCARNMSVEPEHVN